MSGIPFLRCGGCGGMVQLCEHHLDSEEVIHLRQQKMARGHSGCCGGIHDLRKSFVAEQNVARESFAHMEREEARFRKLLALYRKKKREEETGEKQIMQQLRPPFVGLGIARTPARAA